MGLEALKLDPIVLHRARSTPAQHRLMGAVFGADVANRVVTSTVVNSRGERKQVLKRVTPALKSLFARPGRRLRVICAVLSSGARC